MDNLLNLLAVHRSRTPRDLKKEHHDQVDLLVSKHNVEETVTAQKQATGTQTKNLVSKMLTICSLSEPGENYEHEEHTIFNIPCLIDNREQQGSPSLRMPYPPSPFP